MLFSDQMQSDVTLGQILHTSPNKAKQAGGMFSRHPSIMWGFRNVLLSLILGYAPPCTSHDNTSVLRQVCLADQSKA